MSLQIAAKHLASKGRGPDDTLVHMSRDEVKSLSDLAMAHGGHLTTNPETGLPEAGFLSTLLPAIAGAALSAAVPGLGPGMTAAIVGGGSYLLNPKQGLMGGLMAGLGAYGGANLGQALAQQGVEQITAENLAKDQAYVAQQEALKQAALSGTADPKYLSDLAAKQFATQSGAFFDAAKPTDFMGRVNMMGQGIKSLGTEGGFTNLYNKLGDTTLSKVGTIGSLAAPMLTQTAQPPAPVTDKDMGQRYKYSTGIAQPLPAPDVPTYNQMLTQQGNFGRQQNYYPNQGYTRISSDEAKNIYGFADGGQIPSIQGSAAPGAVEAMSRANSIGQNTGFPQANLHQGAYATPWQTPISENMLQGAADTNIDLNTGEMKFADGGISDAHYNLGGYSDGGRLLRGPGDGVSDSIPATIGKKQPARLADGEFVVPARIVSELGNGSTEAGARKLYAMLDRVQAARKKTVGKNKVAHNSRADKYLPA